MSLAISSLFSVFSRQRVGFFEQAGDLLGGSAGSLCHRGPPARSGYPFERHPSDGLTERNQVPYKRPPHQE